uniref:ATP synthase subunit a n=1 Tax=Calisoga longitarsis TaxID=394809 RepID=B2CKU8_9ARAC|nr:ATP synthase subunit 6 [Calisoga longitarsis]
MVSLFSVFDPVSFLGVHMNWVVLGMVVVFSPLFFYGVGGILFEGLKSFIQKVELMFKEISCPYHMGLAMMGITFFVFISLNNGVSMLPYVFGGTSHLVVTLSLGVILWVAFLFMGWLKNFMNSSSHLVPEGSPMMLAPFMVLIESVSHLIRPVTLSVRLAANMMAGHLIIGLISSISLVSVWGMVISVLLQSILLVLEWAVVFIQSFVFSVLIMLYALEYY